MLHLLLLLAVYFAPVWVGGRDAFYSVWSRYAHGSLGGAQYELLAVFWAVSRWDWAGRTLLFVTGLATLSLLHVGIMFSLTGEYDSFFEQFCSLLWNIIDVFVVDALVLAFVLELFRPLWGCLTREAPEKREEVTIFALLRLTTMAALVGAVLRLTGSYFEAPLWSSFRLFLEAAFLVSCTWMIFANRYAWVGMVGCLGSMVSTLLNTPPEIVAQYGPWHWLPSVCLTAFWICSTLLVVRCFGYRLRKRSLDKAVPLPGA